MLDSCYWEMRASKNKWSNGLHNEDWYWGLSWGTLNPKPPCFCKLPNPVEVSFAKPRPQTAPSRAQRPQIPSHGLPDQRFKSYSGCRKSCATSDVQCTVIILGRSYAGWHNTSMSSISQSSPTTAKLVSTLP